MASMGITQGPDPTLGEIPTVDTNAYLCKPANYELSFNLCGTKVNLNDIDDDTRDAAMLAWLYPKGYGR